MSDIHRAGSSRSQRAGLLVTAAQIEGAAFRAGLRAGDIIETHDGGRVGDHDDFASATRSSVSNLLGVIRMGEPMDIECGPGPIGVFVGDVPADVFDRPNLQVSAIRAGGIAQELGVRVGDLIVMHNGERPEGCKPFARELRQTRCNVIYARRDGELLRFEGAGGPWGLSVEDTAGAHSYVTVEGLSPDEHLSLARHLTDLRLVVIVQLVLGLVAIFSSFLKLFSVAVGAYGLAALITLVMLPRCFSRFKVVAQHPEHRVKGELLYGSVVLAALLIANGYAAFGSFQFLQGHFGLDRLDTVRSIVVNYIVVQGCLMFLYTGLAISTWRVAKALEDPKLLELKGYFWWLFAIGLVVSPIALAAVVLLSIAITRASKLLSHARAIEVDLFE